MPGASTAVTPLAVVQMALRASYQPANGFLGVAAQLTSESYLFSKRCRLTGGFAFYSWFDGPHRGDFVLSVGGYHADYRPPDHYPKVPRLGFNWQVDDHLTIKGDAYYAMTAAHLMAGGHAEVELLVRQAEGLVQGRCRFPRRVEAVPLRREDVCRNVGASYTFTFFGTHTITADIAANLHLWGPEFSGTITIDLHIISFDVSFGPGGPATSKRIRLGRVQGVVPAGRRGGLRNRGLADGSAARTRRTRPARRARSPRTWVPSSRRR